MKRALTVTIRFVGLSLLSMTTLAAPAVSSPATGTPQDQTTAAAGIGIRLRDIPAAAQADPRARSYIIDNMSPGTTIQRRVEVENNTDTKQSIRLYAAAAHITGDSFIGEEGTTPNELTNWIAVSHPRLTVAAHQAADDVVTIAVPSTATEGERYAAVWAEVRSAPANHDGTSITSVSRVGVRIYLSVAPGNGPPSAFTITSITALRNADGKPRIVASVTNTGGRAVDLSGSLLLRDGPGSLAAGPFDSDRVTTLAPHADGRITVPLSASLPRGPWNASLTLSSGLLTHTFTAQLTFPAAGSEDTVTAPDLHIPWIIAGLAVLLAGGALIFWLHRRKRRGLPRNSATRGG